MLLRSSVILGIGGVLLAVAAVWLVGCGGSPSSLLVRSGLLLPGAGPAPLPDPDTEPGNEDDDGNGGETEGDNICITWQNNADVDVRVTLYASVSGSIEFPELFNQENLELLPFDDEGCIPEDEITGERGIRPLIQDGNRLSYEMTCDDAASLIFGTGDQNTTIGNESDTFGVLRQGVDFDCGDTLPLTITDDDQDEQPEIGF